MLYVISKLKERIKKLKKIVHPIAVINLIVILIILRANLTCPISNKAQKNL